MAAEEILGISGQMDISDIQASLDKLCDGLNRVGVDTEALSQRMTKALNDIAQSDGDLASKTQQAMNVLKSAMDEATKGMRQVPDMIDTANKKVETIEGTIGKLNDELAKTDKTSNAFTSITKQIEAQKQSLQLAKEDVTDLTNSYANVKNVLSEVGGAYEALNAFSTASSTANGAQTVSNVAVGASATAAATATTAEAAAHTANAAAALGNADAESQNAQATQQLTAALQEYMSVASGRAEVERLQSESAKELKSDMKMYEETIKDIQTVLATSDFGGKIEDATKRIEYQKHIIEQYKEALANLSEGEKSGGTATYYNENIEVAKKKIEELQAKIGEWQHEQERLNNDLQEYNTLLDAAKKIQAGENLTGGFKKATEEAKNTAKETENIGKEAEKAGDKAKGIFDKLKGFITKGFNLDNVLSLVLSPKGATLAGITAVAAGVKNISEICQQLEESLIPLKAYVDGGTLEELRQQFVALEYDSSHSAEETAAGAALGLVGGIAQAHDKRLQRKIEKMQEDVSKIESYTQVISKAQERTLGYDYGHVIRSYQKMYNTGETNVSGSALGAMQQYYAAAGGGDITGYEQQYNLLVQKRRDYSDMYNAENKKKKKSKSSLEEYKSKIAELDDQIKYFSEDIAKNLYSIDLKSWADQLSDALMTAFENGDDAAEAFKNSVTSILQSLTKQMISLGVMQPLFDNLRNKLFGYTDSNGAVHKGSFDASHPDSNKDQWMSDISEALGKDGYIYNGVESSKILFDKMENLVEKSGNTLLNSGSSSAGSSIKGITEQTADILASYLNAIRADVSVLRQLQSGKAADYMDSMSLMAQSQVQYQSQIAANTLRNAEAAEKIVTSNEEILYLFKAVTNDTKTVSTRVR